MCVFTVDYSNCLNKLKMKIAQANVRSIKTAFDFIENAIKTQFKE